jgi:hypothetical protein
MAAWLSTATRCNCDTLDVCKLFKAESLGGEVQATTPLRLEHAGR